MADGEQQGIINSPLEEKEKKAVTVSEKISLSRWRGPIQLMFAFFTNRIIDFKFYVRPIPIHLKQASSCGHTVRAARCQRESFTNGSPNGNASDDTIKDKMKDKNEIKIR